MVKVKICGFTDADDVRKACDMGVDMVGVILVPASKRYVTVERARKVLDAASGKAERVTVLMPAGPEYVKEIYRELEPDYLQIHLTFPAQELQDMREDMDAKIIGVVSIPREIKSPRDIARRALDVAKVSDIVLIDTKGPTGGGTGLTHDWNLSAKIRNSVDKPVLLAGGLNPSNVKHAIKAVRPDGVDVATGVESSPGKKDARLMREFITAARGAR